MQTFEQWWASEERDADWFLPVIAKAAWDASIAAMLAQRPPVSADGPYEQQPTLTLGQLRKAIAQAIRDHGAAFPVRVDTSYDQGQPAMPITGVRVRRAVSNLGRPYIGIEA